MQLLSTLSNLVLSNSYLCSDTYNLPQDSVHPLVAMVGARSLEEYHSYEGELRSLGSRYEHLVRELNGGLDEKIQAIHSYAIRRFETLHQEDKYKIYHDVWALSGPLYGCQMNWGEENATRDPKLLLKILDRRGFLGRKSIPRNVFTRHEAQNSCYYQIDDRPRLEYGEIGYINGLANTLEYAKWDASRFSDQLADAKHFSCIYNATQGGVKDVLMTVPLLSGLIAPPVKLLLDQWQRFFHRAGPDEKFLQISYSQGSIHVKTALELLPLHLRRRICVLSLAPVAYVPFSEDIQVMHFIKRDDHFNRFVIDRKWREIEGARDVTLVQTGEPDTDPHDAFSPNYIATVKPFVERFMRTNNIFPMHGNSEKDDCTIF